MEDEENYSPIIKEELTCVDVLIKMESANGGKEVDSLVDPLSGSLNNDRSFEVDDINKTKEQELSVEDKTLKESVVSNRPVPRTYGNKRFKRQIPEATSQDCDKGKTTPQTMGLIVKQVEAEINSKPGNSTVIFKDIDKNPIFADVKPEPGLSEAKETVRYMDAGNSVPDDLLYCIECLCAFEGDCPKHGALVIIPDTPILDGKDDKYRALKTAPSQVTVTDSKIPNAGRGVLAREIIPDRTQFGPYEGLIVSPNFCSEYAWLIRKNGVPDHCVDALEPSASNWMRFVNCARIEAERNLLAFQYKRKLYFRTIRQVNPGEELLVWCGSNYAQRLGIDRNLETIDVDKFKDATLGKEERLRRRASRPDLLTCDICMELFNTDAERNAHRYTHKDGDCYVCPVCDKRIAQSQNMRRHLMTHSGEKPYPCPMCDKHFSQRVLVKRHMRIHTGERPFGCVECSRRFSREDDLNRHLRSHIGDKPYKCDMCDKKFSLKDSLSKHVRFIHQGERLHSCNLCSKSFYKREHYRKHIAGHVAKSLSCSDCGKKFARKEYLMSHQRYSHCGVKPYTCVHCSRAFVTETELTTHITKVHSGNRMFPCIECNQRFLHLDELNMHLSKHRLEKPFVCPDCNKRYSSQRLLSAHLRKHNKATHFAFVDCNAQVF